MSSDVIAFPVDPIARRLAAEISNFEERAFDNMSSDVIAFPAENVFSLARRLGLGGVAVTTGDIFSVVKKI
ncbi:hypothetical protein CEXT_775311 [Caerostris extrusa]|uniref:Uncharacterized protein n=1 Tax=Caerostris extrusa TaxID=172846 RepID=A0AAV4MIQ3_CAEEX|nr:hypothetical protein CEXT_775311 [Caerostris extrusa]